MKVVSVEEFQKEMSKCFCEMGWVSKNDVMNIINKIKFAIPNKKESEER